MASKKFSWTNMFIRIVAALGLVLVTYNPHEYSYFHWVQAHLENTEGIKDSLPLLAFAGVALLISWVIFLRATLRSLGFVGILLAAAFFATLIWLLMSQGLLPKDSEKVVIYLIEIAIAFVLGVGMSWTHIRRRMSGQLDVDEVDE